MRAAGVDIGKRQFTIASVPFGEKRPTPAVLTVKTKEPDPMTAALFLGKRLRWYVEEAGPFQDVRVVWLEEPWGKFHNVGRELGIVLGVLAAQFPEDVSVASVSPGDWRTILGLPQRSTARTSVKVETQLYAQAATRIGPADAYTLRGETDGSGQTWWDAQPWNEHEADAVAIALACVEEQKSPLAKTASAQYPPRTTKGRP